VEIQELYKLFIQYPEITTDSRKVNSKGIYFALKGEKFDGNAFASNAIQTGAPYAVIDNEKYNVDERTILVANVLETLQNLANYHIKQLQIPVLGITGTNGKTTTKELIRAVLSEKYNVLSTLGNLNNHIGVPLTILSIKPEHNFAVIEMGANHPLEIKQLCEIAEPGYGIITNIGKAHLDGFGGFNGVINTKNELYNWIINKNGSVFYNSNNPILTDLLLNKQVNKIGYGKKANSCSGEVISADPFLKVRISEQKHEFDIHTHIIGTYNLENILAAVAIGQHFGIPWQNIKNAIENYIPSNNRSQFSKTEKNSLFIDCYNSNPSSAEAAIKNLINTVGKSKLAILGDMLELGAESEKEHQNIINTLKENNLNAILIGPIFSKIEKTSDFKTFNNVDLAFNWLNNNPISDSLVLIKGSRGIKLEKLLELL
jgi:UDP-N-acetylmuramoyl-tripeptide--D-alanyl-D-alanine ligase